MTEPEAGARRDHTRTGSRSTRVTAARAALLVLLATLLPPEARGHDPHRTRPAIHPARTFTPCVPLGANSAAIPASRHLADRKTRGAVLSAATLSGVVRDSTSLRPVAFAEVRVSPTGIVAGVAAGVSDRFGAFAIPGAPADRVRIEARALGYAEWARHYDELPAGPIEILLAPAPFLLDSLGVEAAGRTRNPISFSPDAFVVDPAMVRAMPAVLESDVLRALAMSPSASAPSDYVAVPHVRGGTSDGTPIMLDGVRLFNPFHVGGFLSAVSAEAVDHAALLPSSGAGAQQVGSLSGAIEIATRDGARDRHRAAGAVGLASAQLTVDGPLGESASYLVLGRRSYVDLLTRGLAWTGLIEDEFPYSFADLHAKVTRDFGGFRRLSATGYASSEGIAYEWEVGYGPHAGKVSDREHYHWGNIAVALHYRDRLADGVLLDVTAGHSRFGNDQLLVEGLHRDNADTLAYGDGHMTEDRVDVRATWNPSLGRLTAGGQAVRFTGDHDYLNTIADIEDILPPLVLHDRQWRIGAYANIDAPLGRTWRTRAGLRLDRFAGVANTFAPFAEVSHAGAWWEARISVARSYQSLASLRNEESVKASFIAYDLMVPVERGPVPRNSEITAGWVGSRGAWLLRLDAYARRMENLRLPAVPEEPLNALPLGDPSLHSRGSGTVAGVEASWSWAGGSLSTLGSYRWSRATRTVNLVTYAPRFHREHELEYGAALETGRSMWSARFSLRSGQPTTPILAVLPVGGHNSAKSIDTRWVVLKGPHNTGRLPPYLRLDLGWRRTRRGGAPASKRIVTPFVSVTNLFSAPNVVAEEVMIAVDREIEVEAHYVPQMPMLAFFGVEFRF